MSRTETILTLTLIVLCCVVFWIDLILWTLVAIRYLQ